MIESQVGMREMGFWIEPELRRSFSANGNPDFVYHLGARLGVLASDGDFKSAAGLPQGDLGLTVKSNTVSGSGQLVWVASRMLPQFGGRRPPSLKIGTGVQLGSLGRVFVNSDSAKAVQTEVTLNGMHAVVFIEKAF